MLQQTDRYLYFSYGYDCGLYSTSLYFTLSQAQRLLGTLD